MEKIWIVEYCENVGEDSEYTEIQGAFATRELAEKYVDGQPYTDMYYISQTNFYENEENYAKQEDKMNAEEFDTEVKKLQEKVEKESKKNNTTVLLLSSALIVYSRVYGTFFRGSGADWVKAVFAIPILILTIVNLKYAIKLLK